MKEKEVAGENEEEEEGKKILWHPHRKTDRYNTVWKQRTALNWNQYVYMNVLVYVLNFQKVKKNTISPQMKKFRIHTTL